MDSVKENYKNVFSTKFSIKCHTQEQEENWDSFVKQKSMNGTFLQTRKFINYHPKDRFKDCSLMIYKGNTLTA